MRQLLLLTFTLFTFTILGQENAFQKKGNVKTDQEAYSEGQPEYSRVLIIPFEPKMYISGVDRQIAQRTSLTYQQIRDNMRFAISDYMKNAVGGGLKAVSMMHIDTGSVGQDLAYIYNSIGYKYKVLPQEDIEKAKQNEEAAKPINKIKGSFNKLVKNDQTKEKEEPGTSIKDGQIHSTVSYAEKFMNTSIHNPKLLSVLSQKYNADVFLFINELDIEEAASESRNGLSELAYKRKIKVHYTIFDKDGKEIHGGAAIVYMPSTINDMNKIVNGYFPLLAQNMSDHLPASQSSQAEKEKLKEEEKKAEEQRKEIEKL